MLYIDHKHLTSLCIEGSYIKTEINNLKFCCCHEYVGFQRIFHDNTEDPYQHANSRAELANSITNGTVHM